MLAAQTATLLASLWDDPALLADAHPITHRAVHWGTATLTPEPGVAIAADTLASRLAARLHLPAGPPAASCWTLDARPGSPALQRYGRRHAWLAAATLHETAEQHHSRIVRTRTGWLFLLPIGRQAASLQCIGIEPPAEDPHAEIAVAAPEFASAIASLGPWSAPVPAMPRAHPSPAAPARLMVGEAALGFDPLSGDGAGHALRGAILAATTLLAITGSTLEAHALARYEATLRSAITHHLQLCLGFYAEGFDTPEWQQEITAMQTGYLMANTS